MYFVLLMIIAWIAFAYHLQRQCMYKAMHSPTARKRLYDLYKGAGFSDEESKQVVKEYVQKTPLDRIFENPSHALILSPAQSLWAAMEKVVR